VVVFGQALCETTFSVKRLDRGVDLISLTSVLREEYRDVVLLESVEGPDP
jgi:hypothetical protein